MIRSKHWWLITIKGLIFIFLGIYILKYPISGMLGLIVYGGFALILSGLIISVFAITTHKTNHNWTWHIAEGILDIILGIILLLNLGLTAITLPYVFAFFGVLTGIFWIVEALSFKQKGYKPWGVALLAGLLSLIIGILIFLHPVIAMLTIFGFIGCMFILQGFFLVLFSIEISQVKKINDIAVD
jgi:uncharacterized membrane protein HdeD (DUF308 family)